MADYTGTPRRLKNKDWGAVIDREQISVGDGVIHEALRGCTIRIESQAGKSWEKRIKSVDDVSDKYVRVAVEDIPEGETGDRQPGDEEEVVTRTNLRKWFHAIMKDLRDQGVDVEPVKAAMGRVEIDWEAR